MDVQSCHKALSCAVCVYARVRVCVCVYVCMRAGVHALLLSRLHILFFPQVFKTGINQLSRLKIESNILITVNFISHLIKIMCISIEM